MDKKQYTVFKAILDGKTHAVAGKESDISASRVGQIVARVCREIKARIYLSKDAEQIRALERIPRDAKLTEHLEFWSKKLENLWAKTNIAQAAEESSKHRNMQEYHLGYLHNTHIGYRCVAYKLGEDYRIYVHHQSLQFRTEKEAHEHLVIMKNRYGGTLVYGVQEVHVQEPVVVYPAEK